MIGMKFWCQPFRKRQNVTIAKIIEKNVKIIDKGEEIDSQFLSQNEKSNVLKLKVKVNIKVKMQQSKSIETQSQK